MATPKIDGFDDDCSYSSKVKFRSFRFSWTIEDYNYVSRHMSYIQSPKFTSKCEKERQWFIHFKTLDINEESKEEMIFVLQSNVSVDKYVQVSCCIKSASGGEIKMGDDNAIMRTVIPYKINISSLANDLLWNKIPSNYLIFECVVRIFDSMMDVHEKNSIEPSQSEDILGNMSAFFDDETFQDVTFTVQEKEFKAHKSILAARSSIFHAMFKHQMSDEINSVIEIKDCEPFVFKNMLRFIYTDKVYGLKRFALKFLSAADNYDLKKLKEICVSFLYYNLTLQNVLETLKVADTCSTGSLKKKAFEFIVSNMGAIKDMVGFDSLMTSHPHLATELDKFQHKNLSNDEEYPMENVTNSVYQFLDKSS